MLVSPTLSIWKKGARLTFKTPNGPRTVFSIVDMSQVAHVSFGRQLRFVVKLTFELAHGTMVASAPSELVGVAETARARLMHALLAKHWIVRAG